MRAVALAAAASLALGFAAPAHAMDEADIASLRRSVETLRLQNEALERRLRALEGGTNGNGAARRRRAAEGDSLLSPPSLPPVQAEVGPDGRRRPPGVDPETRALTDRVRQLELGRAAQESATRSIMRDALTTLGPNINASVALGGAIEVLSSRARAFRSGPVQNTELATAELDFDIKVNDWVYGSLILGYNTGQGQQVVTADGVNDAIDRVSLDRALVTIGDPQRFPLIFKGGRDVLNFGTSTGIARLDTLSLSGPLTTSAFEIRDNYIGVELALPTPALRPQPPPVAIPPVQPLVINPAFGAIANAMGYRPPALLRPPPLVAVRPPPLPPPVFASLYLFQGDRELAPARGVSQNINASLGFLEGGTCGRTFEELRTSLVCPWNINLQLDYVSSVFGSGFFRNEYRPFLPTIGTVPGVAFSVRGAAGPFGMVGEVNTTLDKTLFVDDAATTIRLRPTAWQVNLSYQFDWNPWIEKIGEQGNYVAIGYSGTNGLQGIQRLLGGATTPTRVGFLPRSRVTLTLGEWLFANARFATEVVVDWDYSRRDGGTGRMASGVFTSLLLTF